MPDPTAPFVKPLGFGCSGAWGMPWFPEEKAVALVRRALDLGIERFDTATFYCNGEAEKRLGRALREHGMTHLAHVSGKVGTRLDRRGRPVKDFSDRAIEDDVRTSLDRLGKDAMDVVYLHGPDEHQTLSSLPLLVDLKSRGVIRAIGLCGDIASLRIAAARVEIDFLMCPFNFLRRRNADAMKAARASGTRVVAIAPLAQGLYRKDFLVPRTLPDLWHLARAMVKNRGELSAARRAQWLHDIDGWSASDLALAYTLAQDFVDEAVTTTTKPAHLDANVAAARRPLPADLFARMDAEAPA